MRPNLLFITTDQQRRDSLSCYGNDWVQTPALQALADEALVFDNCYVSSPICVPCRSTMMTGCYPSATGTMRNNTWLDPHIPTWPAALSRAGYRTAGIGKMHFAPWDALNGFDERIICEDKRHFYLPDDHAKYLEDAGYSRPHPKDVPGYYETVGAPVYPYPEEYHSDVFVAREAVGWLEKHGGEPFAAWVSFPGPHDPYDPPESFASMYDGIEIDDPLPVPEDAGSRPTIREKTVSPGKLSFEESCYVFQMNYQKAGLEEFRLWRRRYHANVSLIDRGVGEIIAALKREGVYDNTLIVFTTDHGDALGDMGLRFKSSFYENVASVPLLVKPADPAVPGRRAQLVATPDIAAAFYEAAGLETPEHVQGQSLLELCRKNPEAIRTRVESELPGKVMSFDGRYKTILFEDGETELYDLLEDPREERNLASDAHYAAVLHEGSAAVLRHIFSCRRVHTELTKKSAYPPREELEREFKLHLPRGAGSSSTSSVSPWPAH